MIQCPGSFGSYKFDMVIALGIDVNTQVLKG